MAPIVAGKERESNVARLLGSGTLTDCRIMNCDFD